MSAATEVTSNERISDTAPRALVRIAIPSFRFGWLKSRKQKSKFVRPTREEMQDLFKDDFRSSDEINSIPASK